MKNAVASFFSLVFLLIASSAFSATLVCDVFPKGRFTSGNNGVANCWGFDTSFGNSTTGRFYIKGITKPVSRVIWDGDASCNGGTSCNVTVRAYSFPRATATILYADGTHETTNTSTMEYETGF